MTFEQQLKAINAKIADHHAAIDHLTQEAYGVYAAIVATSCRDTWPQCAMPVCAGVLAGAGCDAMACGCGDHLDQWGEE